MTIPGEELRRWVGEAPAKVNLFLRILEREADGYHRVETIFQALELSDTISIEARKGEDEPGHSPQGHEGSAAIELRVEGEGADELGPPEANLAFRAAARFQEEIRRRGLIPPAFRIVLEKRIPHGAGLGGGSSDAATVLLGANALAGNPLSPEDLLPIGREIGADVPFFLIGAARALGTGRGEILTPLSPLPQREILLLVPDEGINTGWAYGVLADERKRSGWRSTSEHLGYEPQNSRPPNSRSLSPAPDTQAGADWARVAAAAMNDFESALFPLHPRLRALKEVLVRNGAELALLSGSGSVVFGVFPDSASMESASRVAENVGVQRIETRTRELDS